MIPTLPLHHGALFADHSGFFSPLMECKQKHAFAFLHRRIKAEEPVATQFGTCLHSVLEYRYKLFGTGKVNNEGLVTMGNLMQQHFDANPVPFGERRNLAFAEEITTRYLQRYPTEEFQLLEFEEAKLCQHCHGNGLSSPEAHTPCLYCHGTGRTKAMVELPFVVPLYTHKGPALPYMPLAECVETEEIPVYYIGKIDLPLLRNGQLYVMDHKTTSFLDEKFFWAKKASQQTRMYAYAMWKLTGMKPDGYVINAIHTAETPDYVREGRSYMYKGVKKTPEMYWENSLQRQWHSVTEEQLNEARDNAIELCEEFFWSYSRGKFPRSDTDTVCVNKYSKCPYYVLCHEIAAKDRLDYLASGAYMDSAWSPLNHVQE